MMLLAKYKLKNIPINILPTKKEIFSEKTSFLSILAHLLLNILAEKRALRKKQELKGYKNGICKE